MKSLKNFGLGVDIEDINRFSNLKNKLFLGKIFTKKELEYCFSRKNPAQHLAARFAGKEAIFKALSSMKKPNINYRFLEIINNKNGIPKAKINDKKFNNLHVNISLSHCDGKAIAFAAVMELKNGQA